MSGHRPCPSKTPTTPAFERIFVLVRIVGQCGLGNALIGTELSDAANDAFMHGRQRLGGMLNYYYWQAA